MESLKVSIPFKREGGSKQSNEISKYRTYTSFNSLQTGRRFQTEKVLEMVLAKKVSIPFKREGGSKQIVHNVRTNGNGSVSIPFKREGGSKLKKSNSFAVRSGGKRFQFPSNGKAVQNYYEEFNLIAFDQVSIPFKREGGSKPLLI